MTDSSSGGFGLNPQDVNEAASLMGNLTASGGEVSKVLGVLDPLVFGVVGSSVGVANTSMENAVLQCLQGVLNLFSNTSSDIQAAASSYADADSAVADTLSSLTSAATPGSVTSVTDDIPAEEMPAEFEDDAISAEDALGGLAADEAIPAGLESAVLARLAGSEEMLAEFGEEAGSELMSMFRSLSGPSAVSERWNGLTEDEQEEAIAVGGGTIGSLDGIPSEVRNLINTDELEDLIAETEGHVEELRNAAVQADADHDDDERKALLCLQQAAILQVQLGGLQALRGQLRANPNAYLLGMGTDRNGTGRCILAINSPDTANNVATLVPAVRLGLSEGLVGTSGYLTAAIDLAAAAKQVDQSRTTSVVIWANYSAPLFVKAQAPGRDVEAAPVLAQFQAGLYSTNVNGPQLHTTVIGNRDGSDVVAAAMKLPGGLSADDVIVLGGPGLDAQSAAGLSSTTGGSAADSGSHVWLYASESAGNDTADGMPDLSSSSRLMPDLAHIVTGNYESIFYLVKQ